jgi:elongation factor 1-gamma
MSSYTLHTPAGNFRAFKILIAAEYNSIDITIPEFDANQATTLSPTGKAPVLQTPSGDVIFESTSIARYISKLRRDTGLTGNGSIAQEASVDQWCDFAANQIELPACVWWYPVAGYMPFQQAAHVRAKDDLKKALSVLNAHLKKSESQFLVNDQVTLADIVVASSLVYPFKLVCDGKYLKEFPEVVGWFQKCVGEDEFKAVIGEVAMCKKEVKAAGQ